jgi:hypothetical protein
MRRSCRSPAFLALGCPLAAAEMRGNVFIIRAAVLREIVSQQCADISAASDANTWFVAAGDATNRSARYRPVSFRLEDNSR